MKHKGLKRQGSLYVLAALCVLAAAGLVARYAWAQVVQACTEYTRAFSEDFDATTYKDEAATSAAHWMTPSGHPVPGPIILPALGSNFVVGAADSLGRRIYQCAAGDFDGDSYPDLIGLDISGEYDVYRRQSPVRDPAHPQPLPDQRGRDAALRRRPHDLLRPVLHPHRPGRHHGRGLQRRRPARLLLHAQLLGHLRLQQLQGRDVHQHRHPHRTGLQHHRFHLALPDGRHLLLLGGQPLHLRQHRRPRHGRHRHRHPGHQRGPDLRRRQSRHGQLHRRGLDDRRDVLRRPDGLHRPARRLVRRRGRFRRRRRRRRRRRHGRHDRLPRLLRQRRRRLVHPQRDRHHRPDLHRSGRHRGRRLHRRRTARHVRVHGPGLPRRHGPGPHLVPAEPRRLERPGRLAVPLPQRLHVADPLALRHRHGHVARLRPGQRHRHRHRRRQPFRRLLLHRERAGRGLRALRPGPIDQHRRRLPRSRPPRHHPRPHQRDRSGLAGRLQLRPGGRGPLLQQRRPDLGDLPDLLRAPGSSTAPTCPGTTSRTSAPTSAGGSS